MRSNKVSSISHWQDCSLYFVVTGCLEVTQKSLSDDQEVLIVIKLRKLPSQIQVKKVQDSYVRESTYHPFNHKNLYWVKGLSSTERTDAL